MINNHCLIFCLSALLLAVTGGLPASATELPVPPLHKVVTVAAPANKTAAHGPVKIASTEPPPNCVREISRTYPLVVGIAF